MRWDFRFASAPQLCVMLSNQKQLKMSDENINKEATVKLPIGHLLIVWEILSNKLSGSPINDEFTEEEKRAIWALEDLCEQELINNGLTEKSDKEWEQLIERATEFVKTIPAEFLD